MNLEKTFDCRKRLFLLLFLSVLICTLANAQQIKLNFKNTPIKTVLKELTVQSGYTFAYSNALSQVNESITCNIASNGNIESVLATIFKGKDITYTITGKQIILAPTALKKQNSTVQPKIITGKITDEHNDPLIGVAVKNENTNKYSVSDENGIYVIECKEGDKLSFSLIGMETYTLVAGKTSAVNIPMKIDAIALGDVVVTGYQTITREKVTGAVSTISSDDLQQRMSVNVLDNLEGRVAGLMTYNGGMQIRGISSIHSERTPLLVVDGMPVEMKIEDLNPYDIESVTVLKDAAASAIYGARASNGILVVTTKKAKDKGKTDIDVTVNYTMYDKTNLDYHDNFYMTPSEQVEIELKSLDDLSAHPQWGMYVPMYGMMAGMYSYQGMSNLYMEYYNHLNGLTSDEDYNKKIEKFKTNNYAKEVGEHILRRHQLQQYNIALRNRTDKFSSNLVFNYRHDNTGVQKGNTDQFNIAYRGLYEMNKWFSANFGIQTILNNSESCGDATSLSPFIQSPYLSLFNEDGSHANFSSWGLSNNYYTVPEGYKSNFYNPIDELEYNRIKTNRADIRLQGELVFKIIEGLNINTNFLYETGHYNSAHNIDAQSIVMRTFVNAYTEINPDGTLNYLVPSSGGYLATRDTRSKNWTWRGQLNFNRKFGKHAIDFLAGLEFRETFYKGTKGLMLGYDDQLQSHSTLSIDYPFLSTYSMNPYYGQFYSRQFIYNTYIQNYIGPIQEIKHRYASGYANLTYTYNDKYHLFGSYRSDYADVYGLDTKFRGTPLWSVGASWNLEKENFIKEIKCIDMLKLRTSYGITGNIYQGATSYMTASTGEINTNTLLPISEVESPANPELRWEKTATANIGFDFALFNYRLSGSVDVYHKKGTDIFANALLEDSKGFPSMSMNAASLKNNGVEVMLSSDIFRAKQPGRFQWNTSATFAYNKNTITQVENDATAGYQLMGGNPYKKGYAVSAIWAIRYAGMTPEGNNNGSMQLYYTDATCTETNSSVYSRNPDDVCVYMGQSDPKYTVSWENRFRFRNFSLSAMLVYYGGHVMRMRPCAPYSILGPLMSTYPMAIEYLDAWTPDNTNTVVPGIGKYGVSYTSAEYQYADVYVHKGDFIKLRNIVIGYDLPSKLLSQLKIRGANVRFQIDNPKPLWLGNSLGVDPETGGISRPTSYVFGLNINF